MSQKIRFENHYSARIIEVLFPEGFLIQSNADISFIKNEWTKNLKSWHSPYTCIFDLQNFKILPEYKNAFDKMIQFFSNFFMRKIIGFANENLENFSFPVFVGYENACQEAGLLKKNEMKRDLENFRSRIQIENDFNAHVMEINFLAEIEFLTKDDVLVLKDKIKNILRQWHTPYNILLNCVNCSFSDEANQEFIKLEKFLKSFFCKEILGYAPKKPKETYPFKVFRSRHLAAAELEHEGLQSGSVANCSTRK